MLVPGTPCGSRTGPLPLAVSPSKRASLAWTRAFASRTATARGQDSPALQNKPRGKNSRYLNLKRQISQFKRKNKAYLNLH